MDHEIDIFRNNYEHPRQLKGDGYDYVQSENGTWHNAISGGTVSDYDLRQAIVSDNHKYDFVELESIMAHSEAYKKIHGHYPADHDKKINEAHKKIAASYGGEDGCFDVLIKFGVIGAVGSYAIAVVSNSWNNITSAVKTTGEIVLGVGLGAAGAAITGAVTVGAYKASNFVWEKITGDSSPLKSVLTTAALFAAAGGGAIQVANYPAMGVAVDAQTNKAYTSYGVLGFGLEDEAKQKCKDAGGACAGLKTYRAGTLGCAIYFTRAEEGDVAWAKVKGNPAHAVKGFRERYGEAVLGAEVVCNRAKYTDAVRVEVHKPFGNGGGAINTGASPSPDL